MGSSQLTAPRQIEIFVETTWRKILIRTPFFKPLSNHLTSISRLPFFFTLLFYFFLFFSFLR